MKMRGLKVEHMHGCCNITTIIMGSIILGGIPRVGGSDCMREKIANEIGRERRRREEDKGNAMGVCRHKLC